ncbi:hypothetical protein M3Y95_00823800 [Aphelenchoides besseyi]|nr:hypothetical protein M3Y95_00823800 [Aphelenchoides besseyi]
MPREFFMRFNGNCPKFEVDLHTKDESLVIKMDHEKSGVVSLAEITLTIGKCEIRGRVNNNNGHGSFTPFNLHEQDFPATFQVSKQQLKMDAQKFPCTSIKFDTLGKGAGFKITVKYEGPKELTGLRLTFVDAGIFAERKQGADWSWNGWRIYACIVGG